jgi:hypothetical protein
MQTADDFRFTAHTLLLALDESTLNMMKMVSSSSMGGVAWKSAVLHQQDSFASLHSHLGLPEALELMQQGRFR